MASESEAAHWIDDDASLAKWVERLGAEPRIAVDMEANSMHAYHERICLIQVSTPSDDLIIDPLAVDMAPFLALLADPEIEKVFHGSDYDVLTIKREFSVGVRGLFDTMIAARVLGWPRYGLAPILKDVFGHDANKAFQRYDWGKRPLDRAALHYARYDTHFLLDLREAQWGQLQERERVEYFRRACNRQEKAEPRVKAFDPAGFWKLKGCKGLDGPGKAVLAAVFAWRDERASSVDKPPFRVLPELAMIGLAKQRPTEVSQLARVKGFPKGATRSIGAKLIERITAAAEGPVPTPPPPTPKPPKALTARFDRLRSWRKKEAEALGVETDVILDKASLHRIAEHDPSNAAALAETGVLDAWELDRYGAALLENLHPTSK